MGKHEECTDRKIDGNQNRSMRLLLPSPSCRLWHVARGHGSATSHRESIRTVSRWLAQTRIICCRHAPTSATPMRSFSHASNVVRQQNHQYGAVESATERNANPVPNDEGFDREEDNDEEIVLFHNPVNSSERLMRSGLLVSTIHTLYWIWYTVDFIPTVNQAAMQALHVSPVIGYAGIALAVGIQTAFLWYPYRLISKISYQPTRQKLLLYTHRIPLMRPNLLPSASFPLGTKLSGNPNSQQSRRLEEQGLDQAASQTIVDPGPERTTARLFKLNSASPYAIYIVNELEGDLTRYRGHLAVGPALAPWSRYTLNISAADQVVQPALLLQALLSPEQFGRRGSHSATHESASASSRATGKGSTSWASQRNKVLPVKSRAKTVRSKQRSR
jgi:hypothetical protein